MEAAEQESGLSCPIMTQWFTVGLYCAHWRLLLATHTVGGRHNRVTLETLKFKGSGGDPSWILSAF